jgi:hypothetical protein
MRVASTGLGKTEMQCKVSGMNPDAGFLVLKARSFKPAQWDLKIFLEAKDLPVIVKAFLRPSVIWTIILSFLIPLKNPKEPETL